MIERSITMKFYVVLTLFAVAADALGFVNNRKNCDLSKSECIPFEECPYLFNPFMQLKERAAKLARSLEKFAIVQESRRQLIGFLNSIHLQSCGFHDEDTYKPMICCPIIKSENRIRNVNAVRVENSPFLNENNQQFSCGSFLRKEFWGNKTDLYDYPWSALLEYNSWNGYKYEKQIKCGGVLVSDRYVLTSAKCISYKTNSISRVILGEHDLTTEEDCLDNGDDEHSVTCSEPSVKFDFYEIYLHGELALIQLSRQVEFSDTKMPICLPQKLEIAKQRFMVAGWGKSMIPNELGHSQKLQSRLTELKGDECRLRELSGTTDKICAGTPKEHACIADEGSALMGLETDKNRNARWTVFGVSDMSLSCSTEEGKSSPGLFEKVHDHIEWIREHVKVAQ